MLVEDRHSQTDGVCRVNKIVSQRYQMVHNLHYDLSLMSFQVDVSNDYNTNTVTLPDLTWTFLPPTSSFPHSPPPLSLPSLTFFLSSSLTACLNLAISCSSYQSQLQNEIWLTIIVSQFVGL